MTLDHLDLDAVVACADLVARSGGTEFEVGYLEDGVPVEKARWYAQAKYKGARLIADEKTSPDEAADALSRRILAGGNCTNCFKTVAIGQRVSGSRCGWYRLGAAWVRGCDGKSAATKRENNDGRKNPR